MAKKIDSIKSQLFSRGLALAKTGLKSGSLAASQAIGNVFRNSEQREKVWSTYLLKQAEVLARDFGQLKGSAMKVGQLLSTYGEHFLPAEANQVLKQLQFQSPPLAWPAIEQCLIKELGAEKLSELEVDQEPHAAASIGQVHRARRRSDGRELILKVQYPGVEGAIETDLKFLRTILALGPLLPKGPRFDNIFDEVRQMLYREVDYRNEFSATSRVRTLLKDDPRYVVPEVLERYSTRRLLCSEYLPGATIDGREVAALSQERRNRLGHSYLDLYMRELFEWKWVQTDPHFGNYRVKIDSAGNDQLILFDFGAMRDVPLPFLENYSLILKGGLERKPELIEKGGLGLKILLPDDPRELVQHYVELCFLITEPFAESTEPAARGYDWGKSDLPQRVAKKGSEIVFGYHLRSPPQETVFLDRKLGGCFVFLSRLGCVANYRDVVAQRVPGDISGSHSVKSGQS